MKKTKWFKGMQRYHKIENGVVHRIFATEDTVPEGYSIGMGPIKNAHMSKLISDVHAGKPKSVDHKHKMRLAKLGKPKSESQRKAMSEAHKKRSDEIHRIMAEHNVRWHVAIDILRANKNK